MILEKKKPITPGQRNQVRLLQNVFLSKPRLKNKVKRKINTGGRNFMGIITARHRGSSKTVKIIRKINLLYDGFEGIVLGLERDPNRTALIARIFDLKKKSFNYIVASKNMYPGTKVQAGSFHRNIRLGNRLPLNQIPAGSLISLIGKKKYSLASAAGTFCQLLQKNNFISKLRLPSGKVIFLKSSAYASLGVVSNEKHSLQNFGKAGFSRNKGIRPRVRGVAKNPVDHPHGGGGGKPSVTPWGKPTKGKPTAKKYKIKI